MHASGGAPWCFGSPINKKEIPRHSLFLDLFMGATILLSFLAGKRRFHIPEFLGEFLCKSFSFFFFKKKRRKFFFSFGLCNHVFESIIILRIYAKDVLNYYSLWLFQNEMLPLGTRGFIYKLYLCYALN